MHILFADDSKQNQPSRPGMGPLIAAGGIHVPGDEVNGLEKALHQICEGVGFPPLEEFKWSPDRNIWMRSNLVDDERIDFFRRVFGEAREHGAKAYVVIEDASCRPANSGFDPEMDTVFMLLERYHTALAADDQGLVIVDRPQGGQQQRQKFLSESYLRLREGTTYVQFDRIALSVLSSPSRLVRLLQLADVTVGSVLAFVSGEDKYSPPVFEFVEPLLGAKTMSVAGVGLKIHPHGRYLNLYHWLLGEEVFWQGYSGITLPSSNYPYYSGPTTP